MNTGDDGTGFRGRASQDALAFRRGGSVARSLATGALFLVAALFLVSGQAAPPRDLDRYVERVLDTFETPGMAIAIVERGHAPVLRAYGVRKLGETTPIDEQTLFAIGSTTKAFTAALLAMLVDEGELTWDSRVVDVLPGFRMYDAYASSELTVRDLLVHRSGLGLGAGDLLFYPPTTLSRAEIVRKVRHIEPATSFRSGYAYDNLLYVVAGQVIEAVTGKPWEEAVRQRILEPLQMDRTTTTSAPTDANRVAPHVRLSREARGLGPLTALPGNTNLDNAAPAGALNTTASEVARWLQLQLGRGLDPQTEKRLFSEAQALEMWTPRTLIPIPPNPGALALAQPNFRAYALGWVASDYRGQRIVAHGGGVVGQVCLVVLVPGKDVAFALLTNAEEPGVLSSVQYRLLDHYLGLTSPDWVTAVADVRKARYDKVRETLAATSKAADVPSQGARGPSLPLDQYAGRYQDDWYGQATIEKTSEGLAIRFEHTPALAGPLEHVRHDTFRTRFADLAIEDAYVTFALNPDGTVDRMTLRAVSPLADFSFDYHDLLFRPVR